MSEKPEKILQKAFDVSGDKLPEKSQYSLLSIIVLWSGTGLVEGEGVQTPVRDWTYRELFH